MECASTLHYLLDIIHTEQLDSMAKLAALSILNKLFMDDSDTKTMQTCLKADITTSLLLALDHGLSSACEPADVVYVSVAMEVMSRLAKLNVCQIQPLVTEGVIKRLLDYLDVTGQFYRFGNNIRDVLGKLCQNKQLVGKVKVVAMGMDPLEYIHMHTKNKLKSHVRLPDSVKLCEMYDTGGTEDVAISDFMVQSQLAWQGSFPGKVIKEHDEWQEVLVTQVLDGGMFWAQVGEKCITDVMKLQQQINCDTVLTQHTVMRTGEVVAVKADINGATCHLRAQIMGVSGSVIDVFAVDYGYTLKVQPAEVFSLPDSLRVSLIPRKISLCSVAGIQPKPYDEDLVQMAASVLTSLSKHTYETGVLLGKLDGFGILERLLRRHPNMGLMMQLVSLLNNLAANRRLHKDLVEDSTIIPCVLGILSRCVTDIQTQGLTLLSVDTDVRMLVIRIIMSLTNLMIGNGQARHQFYNNEGISVLLQVLNVLGSRNDTIYRMVSRLYRVFIGRAFIKLGKLDTAETQVPSSQQMTENLTEQTQKISVNREPGQIREQSRKTRVTVSSDSDSETENHFDKEIVHEPRPHHSTRPSAESDRYVRGCSVRLYNDDQHEICPHKNANKISASSVCQHVCGMLNTGHGGKIYFGIDRESCVFGLELNRDERDRFRLGIDRMFVDKIDPSLLHTQFEINPKPVLDPDTDKPIQDLFVIEVCVRAHQGSVYTTAEGVCYRFGSETSFISRLEMRQLIVIEEEARYIEELRSLLQQKACLMTELQLAYPT